MNVHRIRFRPTDAEANKLKLEAETVKARMEDEYRMKEIEIRNRDMGAGGNNNNSSRSAGTKALKLPQFNEDKDDLDAYLIRFKRACTAFEVRQEHRSIQLARLLQGKALDVYQRLADDEVDDYDVLKAQLLKRFRLTEGGYRKRFKTGKLEPGETPAQFAERLKRYLEKWREMAGFEPTYEGIQEMILRDQYFLTCDKSLQIFLKEKGKLSLKEMTKVSNDYLEAHGYPAENHERKINGVSNKAYTHKSNNGQTNAGPPPVTASTQCGNCGMRNHTTNECRAGHGNTDHVVCFQCNQVGPKRNTCPMNRPNRSAGPHTCSELRQCNISQHIRQHIITMVHITVMSPAVTGKLSWHVVA